MRGHTGPSPPQYLGKPRYRPPTALPADATPPADPALPVDPEVLMDPVWPADPALLTEPAWEAVAFAPSRTPAKAGAETMERRTKAMKSLRIGGTP